MNELDSPSQALPTLYEATLDNATVIRLFRDIAACIKIVEIIPKLADRGYVPVLDHGISLDEALSLLISGALHGVQLRYHHDGDQWWDTLMRNSSGIRLVRIRHDCE